MPPPRCRTMGYYMGFREIHYWGFDSSAEITEDRPDGKMHGYEKVESVKDRIKVKKRYSFAFVVAAICSAASFVIV